ncbi:MAG: hypothetical protein HHAS10_12080 [Candidatus Altimarinota bacterium]
MFQISNIPYFPEHQLFYLKINPGTNFGENLINSIKNDLNAFYLPHLWFGMETHCYQAKNRVFIDEYIFSNSLEGINYIMQFFIKLYNGKISFSIDIKRDFILRQSYKHIYKIGLNNHSVLQIKKLGALGAGDFTTSSSIKSSFIQEILPFINENEVIKILFSFSKGSYSSLVKDYLYTQKSKNMNEKEQESFISSFTESQNMFLFQFNISHNLQYRDIKSILYKNLGLYASLYNSYSITEYKTFLDYIPQYKRLLQPEALLSQGLFLPLSHISGTIQDKAIILPSSGFFECNLIKNLNFY